MLPMIEARKDDVASLCREYGVARLEVFGSAADDTYTQDSDLDFLVEFQPGQDLGPWLAHYFDFKTALEDLFGRAVDLVMVGALKNPYFIREVNRSRKLLYMQPDCIAHAR